MDHNQPSPRDATAENAVPVQLWLASQLLVRWKLVTAFPLSVAFVVGLFLIALPRQFTTTTAVVPVAGTSGGLPGGLSASFGLSALGLNTFGPDYYAALFNSDEVLKATVSARDPLILRSGKTVSGLEEWLEVQGDSGKRVELAVRKLRVLVKTEVDAQSGVLYVSVRTHDPYVSAYAVRQLLDNVQRLDGARLSAQASAEGRYLAARLVVVDSEYQAAVARLRGFIEQNRDIRSSPSLQFQQDELTRDLSLKAAIRTDLEQRLEQARADQARDTPVLALLQRPLPSTQPDSRGIVLRVSLALVGGEIFGTLWLLLAVLYEDERRRFPEWHDRVRHLLRQRARDLHAVVLRFRGRKTSH